jgi:hypothetical protein
MWYVLLIAPGAAVAYWLYVRPVLRALPYFKWIYEQADGFWSKAWALCGHSVTIAGATVLQVLSWFFQFIDPLADLLGDPDLRQQITDALQASPTTLGRVMMVISALTIAARLRGIAKGS